MMVRITYDNSAYKEAKSKLPKPDGKHCVICRKLLPKFKRKYCSSECWYKWFNELAPPRTWAEARNKALERDNYICKKCNIKIESDKAEVDHIKPVCLGGENFNLNNLQTLCHECHVEKTQKDLEALSLENKIPTLIRDFYLQIDTKTRTIKNWKLWTEVKK